MAVTTKALRRDDISITRSQFNGLVGAITDGKPGKASCDQASSALKNILFFGEKKTTLRLEKYSIQWNTAGEMFVEVTYYLHPESAMEGYELKINQRLNVLK